MTSDPSSSPYEVVLADLKAKRAQLDAAIAAIEAVMAGTIGGAPSTAPAAASGAAPTHTKPGMFLGMTIADAARQVLEMHKKKLTTKEITDEITLGGVHLTSSNPYNTVGTVLHRQNDIISLGRATWGLASWYPNSGRFKRSKSVGEDEGNGHGEQKSPSRDISEEEGGTPSEPELKALGQTLELKIVQ